MATILITGGTGIIGSALQKFLTGKEHQVIVLTRQPSGNKQQDADPHVSYANWNVEAGEINKEAIVAADYIVHLAGANLAERRWTKKRKKEIVESRTKSSDLLIKAMAETPNKIKAVISASGIGWYGDNSGKADFKENAPTADDFLANTCKQWEAAIEPVTKLNKRLVIFRFGIVLSETGGALEEFKKPLRFGIATILGNGKQITSWIHIYDLCRLVLFTIENEKVQGVYNAVAPRPVSNKELTLALAKKIRRKAFIPIHVPAFLLKLAVGEMSIELLKSSTVNSDKIHKAGYTFLYPALEVALENLKL